MGRGVFVQSGYLVFWDYNNHPCTGYQACPEDACYEAFTKKKKNIYIYICIYIYARNWGLKRRGGHLVSF